MANEAQFTGENIDRNTITQYNYSTSQAVAKGQFFILDETMPYTVVGHGTAATVLPAGIAVEERESDDTTQTRIGLLKKGRVLLVADGTIAVGDAVELGTTANRVAAVGATTLSGRRLARIVGYAMEAAVAGQYFLCAVDIRT